MFNKGWEDQPVDTKKRTRKPRDFFIPVDEKTPEPQKEASIVFLDEIPINIPMHHFCDPRITDTKSGKKGKWGNFHTCVADRKSHPTYAYCPACKAEAKFPKARSNIVHKSYLSVYSLKKWIDKDKKEHTQGKCLFPMTSDTKKTIARLVQKEKAKNSSFTLIGTTINCYRASKEKESVGNTFDIVSSSGIEALIKAYGEEASVPYNYEDIFAPAEFIDMLDDYNAVCQEQCGGDFFDIQNSTIKPRNNNKPFDIDVSEDTTQDEIPF